MADTVCPPLDSTRHINSYLYLYLSDEANVLLDSTRHINSYLYRAAHRSRLVLDPEMCV